MLINSEITAVASRGLEDRLAELLFEHGSIKGSDGEPRPIYEEEVARMRVFLILSADFKICFRK